MKKIVDKAKQTGITAIIASDQAVIGYAASVNMEVHISTQTNVTNLETIRFFFSFCRCGYFIEGIVLTPSKRNNKRNRKTADKRALRKFNKD